MVPRVFGTCGALGGYGPRVGAGHPVEIAQQTRPDNPLRYDTLKRLTSVRAAAGEFADADSYQQMAINWRETILGVNDPKVADDLLVSAGLCRGMKNYDRAHLILARDGNPPGCVGFRQHRGGGRFQPHRPGLHGAEKCAFGHRLAQHRARDSNEVDRAARSVAGAGSRSGAYITGVSAACW